MDFVYFFSSFPGGGSFFLICVMNKVVFEKKKKEKTKDTDILEIYCKLQIINIRSLKRPNLDKNLTFKQQMFNRKLQNV